MLVKSLCAPAEQQASRCLALVFFRFGVKPSINHVIVVFEVGLFLQ
jgi:hypothetical protein